MVSRQGVMQARREHSVSRVQEPHHEEGADARDGELDYRPRLEEYS